MTTPQNIDAIKQKISNYEKMIAACERRLPVAKAELEAAVKASADLFDTKWGTMEHEDAVRQEGHLEDEVKILEGTIRKIKTWITTEDENLTAAMFTCS